MKKSKNHFLEIVPIGGLGEIGLNCMAIKYGDEIIVIDCGVLFSDHQHFGVEIVLPDFRYIEENKKQIKAYLITHAHEDHIGALPFALKKAPAPVYCTRFAKKLIESKLEEHKLLGKVEFVDFYPEKPAQFKNFKVKPHFVNHSIIESMALFIETPLGKLVFTGDFKIDHNPYYGSPFDPKPFIKAGKDGVLLLLSDSTNVERDGHSLSESTIYAKFVEILKYARGYTIVAVFASNIARIGQILEIANNLNKKVAVLGRSMDQNIRAAFELGYLKDLKKILIPIEEISKYHREQVVILSTGSQGEYRSALSRIAQNEHKKVKIQEGDTVVMSSKFIPGNEKAIGRMINSLFKLGADVLYENIADIHVSGHANAEELRQMLAWCNPKFFIPIHGEYRHLVRHRKLAIEHGLLKENTLVAVNGDIIHLTNSSLSIVNHFDENRIFIEETSKNILTKSIIKDRKKLAQSGVVFCAISKQPHIKKEPFDIAITTKGIFENPDELLEEEATEIKQIQNKIEKRAKDLVLATIEDYEEIKKNKHVDLQEEVRIVLRRYYGEILGKKPVVVPVLINF
jgi:ribonuclease J